MDRARWGLMVAAFVLLFVLQIAAAEPVVETFGNGCQVAVEVDRTRPVAAFRVYVRAGSIYEGEHLGGGITHFLEHTISEGSQSRTLEEIEAELNELGNTYNAYTTKDHTCYYATTSGEQIGRLIDVISDFVLHPTFAAEHVETQRGIIQREMAMVDDEPGRRIADLTYETLFTTHPERYRIIGYQSVFNSITRDDIVRYHSRLYVPDNIVVAVVGDFDGEAVLAQLREVYGSLPRVPPPSVQLAQEPEQITPRRRVEDDPRVSRAYMRIGWPTVSLFDEDLYALDTLSGYLTGGDSALLVGRLRDELGLVDSIASYSATPSYDAGHFGFAATLDPANLERVEQEIIATLEEIKRTPPPRREIERVLKQVEAGEVFAQETAEGRASTLGANLLLVGDAQFNERYVEGLRQVTPEQVQQVARKYFGPDRMNVAVLRPPVDEAPGAAQEIAGTEATTHERTLDNGLRVIVRENHSLPSVSIATATLGGLRYETAENVGITSLMAQMLVRGTQHHTRQELAERVDRLGGSLVPYSGRNSFGLTAQFLSSDLPAALELTVDALFRPTFPEEELERERQLSLARIARQADDVQSVAIRTLLEELFHEHPYRFMPVGTQESVSTLTVADLKSFHAAYARPAATAIVVAGDVEPEAVFAEIARLTDGLSAELPQPPVAPTEPPITEPRERLIERAQEQAIVAYGFHGLKVNDPDADVLDVMDAVLSGAGMPGGRLHDALRGQQLVYFVHGTPMPGLDPGSYLIQAGTAPDTVATVREQVETIVRSLVAEPPSEEELELAKRAVVQNYRAAIETNAALAQTIALDVIYEIGARDWETYEERIEAVTAEQVRRMAERVLELERAAIVVTTPAAAGAQNEG